MGKACILESGFSLETPWIRHLCRKRNLVSRSLCWYNFSAITLYQRQSCSRAVFHTWPGPALWRSLPVSKEKAWEGQHISFANSFLMKSRGFFPQHILWLSLKFLRELFYLEIYFCVHRDACCYPNFSDGLCSCFHKHLKTSPWKISKSAAWFFSVLQPSEVGSQCRYLIFSFLLIFYLESFPGCQQAPGNLSMW